jgi:hypothetical protein
MEPSSEQDDDAYTVSRKAASAQSVDVETASPVKTSTSSWAGITITVERERSVLCGVSVDASTGEQ